MEGAVGQKYAINVFNRGIAQDLLHDIPHGQVRDTYIRANRMIVNQDLINALKVLPGNSYVDNIAGGSSGVAKMLALYEMNGSVYTFWAFSNNSLIKIYKDFDLIGQNMNYPGDYSNGYLYVDGNPDSMEIAITDNAIAPIILDVEDMDDSKLTQKYQADYDSSLYEINQDVHLTQPAFRGLRNLGVGGGVRVGSYSYAYRLVSENGDSTPWSPPTPFIPVPSNYGQGTQSNFVPGAKTYGEAPSLNYSKYGVDIAFRVINLTGFDFVEVKRIPNNVGGPVEYTASPQFLRLETSISDTSITVVRFTDNSALSWASLDDSNTLENSTIATARTVRFYDNRVVLGGVTYESRLFEDTTAFKDVPGTSIQGLAYKENLGEDGYTDIYNQVYNKTHRLGERYSYAGQLVDGSGSRSFALPFPDLVNFKFPERRTLFSSSYNTGAATAATVNSDDGQVTGACYEVYDQKAYAKSTSRLVNIVTGIDSDGDSVNESYNPLHPTSREDSDDTEHGRATCSVIEGSQAYAPDVYGADILATGMKLGGMDVSKLPSWAEGFSVLRSNPANRVVAQGIGMYALVPAASSTSKSQTKMWFYSPEMDSVIGNKPAVFDDIIAHPEDYEVQLVSPVAWSPEFYSGALVGSTGAGIDMAAIATSYYSSDKTNPFDSDATTGRGDGYVTFGRWRNTSNQGSGIDYDADEYILSIDAASIVSLPNPSNGIDMTGRSKYLELDFGSTQIYSTNVLGTNLSTDDVTNRAAQEPWYVINIVRTGARVGDNNVDVFNEIGHYIKLNSLVGFGSGVLDQSVEVVSERVNDFYRPALSTAAGEFSYIYVNNQLWLDVTHWSSTDVDAIRTTLNGSDTFNQQYGATGNYSGDCYGIYEVEELDGIYYIKFPYQTIGTSTDIIPEEGDNIEVRYNSDYPIDLLLGDNVIGPAMFVPIDCKTDPDDRTDYRGQLLLGPKAFPFQSFQFEDELYHSPADTASATVANRYSSGDDIPMGYLRQLAVVFMCESTVNLPFVYKDFFPYKNYVMRPMVFTEKDDDDTERQHVAGMNIYDGYVDDYPGEYLTWGYGGFHFPQGYNFDHNKLHTEFYSEKPVGVDEILEYPKRIQWGLKRSAASIVKGVSRTMPATNVYDVLLKEGSEINILYDEYSGKGTNLYAILDTGVVGLITNKQVLRDGMADDLGVILSDSGFIQGELWLDRYVGTPDLRWRGRAEGSIKQNGVFAPVLVFVGDDDIHILTGNSVASMGTNFRGTIVDLVKGITNDTILSGVVNPARNELWLLIDDTIYIYSFAVNNWVGFHDVALLSGLTFSKVYDGTRTPTLFITNEFAAQPAIHILSIYKESSSVTWASGGGNTPYVEFAVTPAGFKQYRFEDIFVQSSTRPYRIEVSIDSDFADSYTAEQAEIKDVTGGYRVTLGRTDDGSTLIGNTLYVKVTLPATGLHTMGYARTGYSEVIGG